MVKKNVWTLSADETHCAARRRLWCAKIESHHMFEVVVICLIFMSCASLAVEGPSCQAVEVADGSLQADVGLEDSLDDCTAYKYRHHFMFIRYSVYGVFILEMMLCSVSRGFMMTSCKTVGPYLGNNICRIDFLIICIITFCMMDTTDSKGLRFVRSMSPSVGLVRHQHIKNILNSLASSLPALFVVSVPIIFLMAMLAIVGVDLFGNGQMKRCVLENNVLSYLGDGDYLSYNITQCHAEAISNGGQIVEGNDFPVGGVFTWANPELDFDNAIHGIKALLAAATAGVMPTQNVVMEVSQSIYTSAKCVHCAHTIFHMPTRCVCFVDPRPWATTGTGCVQVKPVLFCGFPLDIHFFSHEP